MSLSDAPETRPEQIRAGLRDSLSVGLGILPLGIGLGFLVIQSALPWWVAPALSIGIFAGSVEFLMVGLLAAGASLATIAVTVFAVNFRHVFYAFSFPVHLTRPGIGRAYSVYAMIDEAYATAVMVPASQNSGPRLLSMQIACHSYWVGGSLLGVWLASALPQTLEGFEFALVALFTVMTLDAFRGKRELTSTLLAGVSVAFALVATPDSAMIVALSVFFVLLTARYLLLRRGGLPRVSDEDAPNDGSTQ
ncbi:AzlC family ABC transporter permease [Leucobacter chinensis]|uniref:AzlC family ABC transporter permease n=1 Tax=Leucobacter chinensis TaxID=2851010 RepID=UPI001C24E499|nr:AzlC family ABC transporter permease [Leucobacter chinensis]